jgi:DNA-binding response OmpR family regulator
VARVLVVEDDERVARLVDRALRDDGHVITHAATGPDGLGAAMSTDFDLIVLDLMLPGPAGTEVPDQSTARVALCHIRRR